MQSKTRPSIRALSRLTGRQGNVLSGVQLVIEREASTHALTLPNKIANTSRPVVPSQAPATAKTTMEPAIIIPARRFHARNGSPMSNTSTSPSNQRETTGSAPLPAAVPDGESAAPSSSATVSKGIPLNSPLRKSVADKGVRSLSLAGGFTANHIRLVPEPARSIE